MERQWNQTCHTSETGECLGVPSSTIRSGDLDDEKSREETIGAFRCGVGGERWECRGWREKTNV